MWHSHMLGSMHGYRVDCAALTGFSSPPDHDDSVNDRSTPETKLNAQTSVTKRLWWEAYGVSMVKVFVFNFEAVV